jgi:hypothetical protein
LQWHGGKTRLPFPCELPELLPVDPLPPEPLDGELFDPLLADPLLPDPLDPLSTGPLLPDPPLSLGGVGCAGGALPPPDPLL